MVIRVHKATIAIFLVAVLVFCALPYFPDGTAVTTAGSTYDNWGLSFREAGKTPVGNATKEFLAKYDSYFVGNEAEKVIYLTFDAGYENGNTAKILDTLKKHEVPAAFFLVGNYIDREPELVLRMRDEGHVVGNHTLSHPDMSAIESEEKFSAELSGLSEKYEKVCGEEMKKFYRPPQGKFSEKNLQMAQRLGYKTVFWSLAYVDWYENKQPTRESAMKTLTERIHPGAVVLLHSTSKTNAEILDDLLTKWKEMGYRFESIEKL